MEILFIILFYLLFIVLAINVIYLFIFSAAGKFGKVKNCIDCDDLMSFVIFIPAYKEDAVILDTATEALKQDYPSDKFKVVVIADSLQDQTLEKLNNMPVEIVEVKFQNSTKAKALNQALRQIEVEFEAVVVLDADNIMCRDFLRKVNRELRGGYLAVQGHRIAKNQNNSMALLDAASEEINNHIFRKGHRILGFSSALIGSGMAFRYKYFKNIMKEIHSIGEDKEMELALLRDKTKIAYREDAIVYDEKVQKLSVFRNQRRRWIFAQLYFFKKYFVSGWRHLFMEGNWDYFNKVFQTFLFPRLLLLGFTSLFFAASFILPVMPPPEACLILWIFCLLTLGMALPPRFLNRKLAVAVFFLPMIFLEMVLILFRLKDTGKKFTHTPHTVVDTKIMQAQSVEKINKS